MLGTHALLLDRLIDLFLFYSVALARAVYARTKYVLLDDPLSAVDSHTARFLYERLFRGPLLANRTVVSVALPSTPHPPSGAFAPLLTVPLSVYPFVR